MNDSSLDGAKILSLNSLNPGYFRRVLTNFRQEGWLSSQAKRDYPSSDRLMQILVRKPSQVNCEGSPKMTLFATSSRPLKL